MEPRNNLTKQILTDVANDIGTNPKWLSQLIQFESGWNPQAHNPNSSARGLIQFTDKTAQSLGYDSSADLVQRNPDTNTQLAFPVREYLRRYAPLDTDQALFMAVFYPSAKEWPLDKEFPQFVQDVNPGIVTVRDYMNMVYRRPAPYAAALLVTALGGWLVYVYLLKGR